ncbi:uncharacterized protein LOC142241530 [Haematobia irritans]|uniref:uncharacterized protein LOC142241530 n=1 Tax=Haematobia irritans TaxID=7368 RepID=UPI003F4F79CB
MKTLLLSSDDIQNFRKLIYDPKVANLGNSTEEANLMALQYYLKHPGNYTVSSAAATSVAAAAATAATVTSQVHGQRSHPQTPTFLTTTSAVTTNHTQTHKNNHNNNSSVTQPANGVSVVVTSSNNNNNKINNGVTGTNTSHSHHAHHHLLAQSQTQLKQLQLKQPTIHHHQHAASFHHPYYQQHSTPVPAHAHSTSTTTHNSYSHSIPVHALNQNSNFSAASSSTGGGTASSHATTQQSNTTGSSLSPPGTNSSARTTPSSGSNSSSSSNGSSSRGSTVSGAKKLKVEPVLSQFHQTERLTFANSHVNWTENHWRRVVFQDERKFNLDGPDGFSYYFHDLRNYERTLSQRPRGNSVYIYLVLTAGGPIHLEVSTAKFKIESCVDTILRERPNIVSKLGGTNDFYLQDHNWTTNALPSVQEWLNAESIKTQKWPTVAHDLNIMEGIWGWLIREVFDGGRKFSRKDDLIFRIREAWSRVPMELISNLYTTLSERMTQLYYTRGAYTNC